MVIPSDQQLLLDLLANPNLSEQDRKLLAFELKQKIRSERNRYRLQLIKDAAPDKKIVVLDRETLELLKESRQSEEKDLSARGLATNSREDIKGSNDNLQSAGQQNVSGREPHSSSAVSGLSHNTGHAAKPPGQSLKSFEELHPRRVVQACNFDVSVLGSSQTAKPLNTGPAPAAQLRKKVEEQEVNVVDRSGDESAQDTLKSNHDMDFSEAINRKIPTDPRGPSDVRDASTKHAQKGHKKKDDNRVRRSSGLQNRDNPDRISFSDETVWLERLVTKALEKQKKHDEEIKRKEKHPDLFSPPPKGGHPGLPVLVAIPPDNRLPVDVVDNCSTERKAHAPDEIVFSSSENVLEENIAMDDRKAWLEDLVRAASPLPGSTLKSPKSLNGQTNPLEILRRSEHEKQSIKTPPLFEETLLSKQDVPVNAENPSLAEPNSSLDANFNERKPKPVPLQPAKTTTHKDETFDLQRFLANKTHASSPSTEQGDRLSNSSRSSKKENFTIPENSVDAEPEAFASDADNPDIETHSMTSSEKIRNWRVDERSSTPDIDLDEETLPTYQIPNIKDKIVVFQNAGEEVTQRRHTLGEGKSKLNLKPVATSSFLNDIYIGKDFDLTVKGGKQASGTVKQAKGAPQQTVGDEKAQEKAPFSLDMVSQWRVEESIDALRKLGASLLGRVEDNPLSNPVSSHTRTAQDLVDAPGQGRATHAVRNENQVVSACAIQDERIQREVAEIQEREAELRKRRQSWGALASSTRTTTIPSSLVPSTALHSESDAMAAAPEVRDRDGTESVSSSSSSDSAPVRIFGKNQAIGAMFSEKDRLKMNQISLLQRERMEEERRQAELEQQRRKGLGIGVL